MATCLTNRQHIAAWEWVFMWAPSHLSNEVMPKESVNAAAQSLATEKSEHQVSPNNRWTLRYGNGSRSL